MDDKQNEKYSTVAKVIMNQSGMFDHDYEELDAIMAILYANFPPEPVEYCEWTKSDEPRFPYHAPHKYLSEYIPKDGICTCGKRIKVKE